jgi:hypothetical protein
MVRWLRLVVALMMLVALPLQGLAAVSALQCGVDHEAADSAAAGATSPRADSHPHGSHSSPHHRASAVADSDAAGTDASTHSHDAESGPSCCAGALILDSALDFPVAPLAAREPLEHRSVHYSDHTPERLDRPPLATLL